MKFLMHPSPVTFVSASFACAAACLLCIATSHAQTQEEFELNNGRRLAADTVKPSPGGFTATYLIGTAQQTVTFTAKEVVRATLREPKEVAEARTLIASEKPDKALELLTKAEPALLPYQAIPDSWWQRAAILRMDALAALGKNREAADIVTADLLSKLPADNASMLKDFQRVVGPPGKDLADKIDALRTIADRTMDSWVVARVWLEIGNTLAMQGKMEDAVKSWLRVPVFYPAERDLAARGTILAARGLQQIDRPADGFKLLEDYLSDHLGSPYKATIQIEAEKLDPKRKKPSPDEAQPVPAEETNK